MASGFNIHWRKNGNSQKPTPRLQPLAGLYDSLPQSDRADSALGRLYQDHRAELLRILGNGDITACRRFLPADLRRIADRCQHQRRIRPAHGLGAGALQLSRQEDRRRAG